MNLSMERFKTLARMSITCEKYASERASRGRKQSTQSLPELHMDGFVTRAGAGDVLDVQKRLEKKFVTNINGLHSVCK